MKVIILLALLGIAAAAVTRINEELDEDWEAYKTTFGKDYKDDAEERTRRTIWEKNLKVIQHHNIRYSLGEVTYTLGMNKYGDLTTKEFVEMLNGYKASDKKDSITFLPPLNDPIPPSVDWRTKGYVTDIKDQGQCGSCWAFSTTGGLEGQWFRKTGKLISLSEQNLVDCSFSEGNLGCFGGQMDNAFNYIKKNGIESEADYPYTAKFGICHFHASKKVASDTGFVDIPTGNETSLTAAIASVGPISIAIDASQQSFQLYKDGVYNEPACSSTSLDHGVLAVGYDTDKTSGDYYIVKNSWGTTWGQKGYIWMTRNKNNQCGIATRASYPTV